MNLFSKFRQWHNGGLVNKQMDIKMSERGKAVKACLNKYDVDVVKPHIYPIYHPKSNRVYWRVSLMPHPWNPDDKELWDKAHNRAAYLNGLIADKIEAERVAKKEKQK